MNTESFSFNRVMIIDDTKIDRYLATFIMKKSHFAKEIIEFDMATKAIEFLEQNQDNSEQLPEVILLDIRMPEMDGFEFLEKMELLPESVKQHCGIFMLSSSLYPSDLERAENDPLVRKFINKPISEIKLQEIVGCLVI